MPPAAVAALFAYAFISNVAMAVLPHEPVVIWYGGEYGVWWTALVATAGTVAAAWIDHRAFTPLLARIADRPLFAAGVVGWLRRHFARAPFAILTASAVTPLPAFPFKAIAFAQRYPLDRYLAAVALGRFPRHLLLAWLGLVITIPTWVLLALFGAMLLPSLRMLWKRRHAK